MIRFLAMAATVWYGLALGQPTSNKAIMNRLDDLEYDQQMRDIQKRAEQQSVQVPRAVPTEMGFVQEVRTRSDKYRFIERVGDFDYYVSLPINRRSDGDISFTTILLSDEVLDSGGVKYSSIMSSVFMDCKGKSVRILDGHAMSPKGKIVSTVQGRKFAYGKNTKIWSTIDSLYCR